MNKFFKHFLFEGEPSALSGGGETPPAGEVIPEASSEPQSIYGDLKVNFPEGLEDTYRQDVNLKPFVNKEDGNLNYSNLIKSYINTKKMVGANKVTVPNENSTQEEIDSFYEKIGYKRDENEYVIEKKEDYILNEDALNKFKGFAREHRLPVSVANKMAEYLNSTVKEVNDFSTQETAKQIEEGLTNLKTEWGQAYEPKLGVARRVLTEIVKDQSVMEVFADPRIGSNPAVIKALTAIGEKLYKEDGFGNRNNTSNALSPAEASEQINAIMGDRNHPYHNSNHPSHNDAVNKMLKLFEMKSGR